MKNLLSFNHEFVISVLVLIISVAIVQFFGIRAIRQGDITFDIADSNNYLNVAQMNYSETSGLFEHAWEALHSFKSNILKQKAPGTQLVVVPIVRMMKGAYVTELRQYSFLWMIPSVFVLFVALRMIVKPRSALIGALFFLLSQTTIMTFSHFYQEMTAIPAVCVALAVFIYEVKHGGCKSLSWVPCGILLGLGMYTKVSYVFIFAWIWVGLFVISGSLGEAITRRKRLFYEGVVAYCVASFWWPSHFLYVLKYTQGGYAKHGVQTNVAFERILLFFRSDFIYMYGFWLTLLLLVVAGLALIWHRKAVIAALKVVLRDRIVLCCFFLIVALVGYLFVDRYKGSAKTGSFLVLTGLLLIAMSRSQIIMRGVVSNRLAALMIVSLPLLVVWFQRLNGNNFNPRPYSVVIPLAAAVVAILFDAIQRTGAQKRLSVLVLLPAIIAIGLTLHVATLAGFGVSAKQHRNHRFLTPFTAVCTLADLSALPSIAPLPKDGSLSIGFVGNGNISPHLIQYAYFPHVARITPINFFAIPGRFRDVKEKSAKELVDLAQDVDYVVVPKNDQVVFIAQHTPLAGTLLEKENAMNKEFASILQEDSRFELLLERPNIKGKADGVYVFRVVR